MKRIFLALLALVTMDATAEPFVAIPLHSKITRVQPMTGIVLWDDSNHRSTDAIQLEYSYMRYSDVVSRKNTYDWSPVEKKLRAISRRGHQAILRFYLVYPGKPTAVPAYIKALPDYQETQALSEGKSTGFPDWSHPELKRLVKEFHDRFAARYDRDARLAFVQTGFGLWAEYHIYDGPFKLGQTFPDKAFQAEFLQHLATVYQETPWSISKDASEKRVSPIPENDALLKLPFGIFDDSFLCKQHAWENEPKWNALGRSRYRREPAGGEFSYYTKRDQKLALAPNGPHGLSFEKAAKAFHISYMIGNDQPLYQPLSRIEQAGLACGYRFRITAFFANETRSRVTVSNTGVAPIYRDAFVAVNGVRAAASLKGLTPGKSSTYEIASGGASPRLEITSDHLVKGQQIGYEADLK
ncbi:MAG: DUF4832 domain-containing protein [Verrucomicrobiota bacterium]